MALVVISMIASVSSSIFGSATSSRRTSPMPCHTTAFMPGSLRLLRRHAGATQGAHRESDGRTDCVRGTPLVSGQGSRLAGLGDDAQYEGGCVGPAAGRNRLDRCALG